MFLSLPGSDKNKKRNFESQMKREMIINTLLPSLTVCTFGRNNIVFTFTTRVKIGRQRDEVIEDQTGIRSF